MTIQFIRKLVATSVAILTTLCLISPSLAIAGDDYKIGYSVGGNGPNKTDYGLYWRGDSGDTKNAEFRKGGAGDNFFIEKLGSNQVRIGFNVVGGDGPTRGKHFLFWRGDNGDTKNAEFRKSDSGDIFFIEPAGTGRYRIGFNVVGGNGPTKGKHYLFWRGDNGDTKNAEFRKGDSGDVFYLQRSF